ncbi:MAG: hypothetical protein A2Z83_02105 [Omnitrophica bacterium GWA2_52_8]|nr:MAG: hypothetical protein A2Z83_02105 [Omnitrophica bacterium GWA2_52_8]
MENNLVVDEARLGLAGIAIVAVMLLGLGVKTALAEDAAGMAVATDGDSAVGHQGWRGFWGALKNNPELREKLDQNADGEIDETERQNGREVFQAAREEKRQQWLTEHPQAAEKLDKNGDGTVDAAEFKQARRGKMRQEHREDRLDRNNDGTVGPRESLKDRKMEQRGNFWENHPELKEKADVNGDGQIDHREWKQTKSEYRDHQYFENHPGLQERLDRNEDGEVGRREAAAGRKIKQSREFYENHPGAAKRADSNQNGRLNRHEIKEFRQDTRRADRNRDHIVDRVERRQMNHVQNRNRR